MTSGQMNPSHSGCAVLGQQALQRLAANELGPDELERLEAHVDSCPDCAHRLHTESPSPEWDAEVLKALAAQEGDDLQLTEGPSEGGPSIDSLMRLLGPTDNPRMLGRIGTYEVSGVVGRGGMGVVFKAFDETLNRFVAIKMLSPHLAECGAARKRFAREAKAAAAVVDDHVLPIHGVSEWNGHPYIVSPFCRGATLEKRIRENGPLEVREILRIAMQTAKGLAAAHAQGLVHRDVKPANILLDEGVERVQLTDFGLARAMDDASMTRTNAVAGTPQFMSPEQSRGEVLDARSDLFALGCVMYAMSTGRPPFRGPHPLAVLQKIATERAAPVHSLNADIPKPLSQIIDRLLEKQPERRFQSAREVAGLLEQYLAHLQQPHAVARPRLPGSGRTFALRLAGGLALALGLAVMGWNLPKPLGFAGDGSELPSATRGAGEPAEHGECLPISPGEILAAEGQPSAQQTWSAVEGYEREMTEADSDLQRIRESARSILAGWPDGTGGPAGPGDALTAGLEELKRDVEQLETRNWNW